MLTNQVLLKISKQAFLDSSTLPGVYIYWNKLKKPIYVGKALNLKNRLNSYLNVKLEVKTQKLMLEAEYFSTTLVGTELEALLLEAKLINKYKPKYNIQLKDDKHPLYIKITNDIYPMVKTARKMDLINKRQLYYGPFPAAANVKFILKFIRKIVNYSDHSPQKKPCIYHQIGVCDPCPSQVDAETDILLKKELVNRFQINVRIVKKLLSGQGSALSGILRNKMSQESKNLNFEKAAYFKEILTRYEYITQPISRIDSFVENPNFLEDIRNIETSSLKTLLNPYIKIDKLLRIECFDIAHLSGSSATASMVTFISGSPDKSLYRKFKIRQIRGSSDVDSMKEIAQRRFKHLEDWGIPDLIIVDGGKTQLNVFKEVFDVVNLPVIGLAKRFETIVVKNEEKKYIEIRVRGSALNLLQRIRDEAHRFARVYHHNLVTKTLLGK